MKMMIKLFAIVALLAMTASCATTTTAPSALPEKYNLSNELKAVKKINAINVSNWDQIDKQALIFTANGGEFFLAVLDRPLETDIASQVIGIVDQKSTITAGFDKFFIRTAKGRQYYLIEKIYVLAGRDQAKEMKEKLSK
ncbi:MAG: hypothetical protein GX654_17275 [Desulfatiglans sp.]|jgi:hypothetical protein|nr:hypothetical protein [Desulfatiglans sp.]